MAKIDRSTSGIINMNEQAAYKQATNCTKSTKNEKIVSKRLCKKAKRKEYH
jgi:hypothetical protein